MNGRFPRGVGIGSSGRYLAAVMALGALVRFIAIGKASLWHDEGYSLMMAAKTWAQIWHHTGLDVHPPLYYWTLHAWMLLFGDSEAAVRSLSAVLMVLVIPVMYDLVRRLFSEPAARLTALFVALGPFLVRYSQEARMYGMLTFIAALATYLLVRAQQRGGWIVWILYAVTVAAGLYTYYYVIFVIVFHWVYMAVCAIWPRPSWRRARNTLLAPRWLAANALAVALWVPWMPTAYVQLTQIQSPPWIQRATWETLPASFAQFVLFTDVGVKSAGRPLALLRDAFFLAVATMFLALLWQRRAAPLPVALMGLYMGLAPVLVWVLSFGARPKYVDRYLVFSASAFYAVLAILYIHGRPLSRHRWVQRGAIAVTVIVFLVGIGNVYRQANHEMRQLSAAISVLYRPGDALLVGEFYTFFDFRYYARRHGWPDARVWVPHDFPFCCEGRSLLADQPHLIVKNMADEHPATGYVWLVGFDYAHHYLDAVPPTWQPAGEPIVRGYVEARRFRVGR